MTVFYVATTGNNANQGTLSAPWKTFAYATEQLNAGDTLYIRGGTYNELLVVKKHGTAALPIRVSAYQNETVIIDGEYLLANEPYVRTSTDTDENGVPKGYHFYPLVDIQGNYVTIENLQVKRSLGRGLRVNMCHHSTFRNIHVDGCRGGACAVLDSQYITIDGCSSNDTQNYAQYVRSGSVLNWPVTWQFRRAENCLFENNTVRNAWGEGMCFDTPCYDCVARNNIIYDTWRVGMYINRSHRCVFDSNLVFQRSNPYRSQEHLWPSAGDGLTFRHEAAFDTENNKDNIMMNNFIIGRSTNFVLGNQKGATNDEYEDNWFINNTILNGLDQGIAIGSLVKIKAGFKVYIENNIIYQTNQKPLIGGSAITSSLGTKIKFDYNLWWDGNGNMPFLAARGANDLYVNPQFINANPALIETLSAANFKLNTGSPAINTGIII